MSDVKKGINVLSLFDGISCGRLALERAGIKINKYFASEIDPYAIAVSKRNYPDNIHVGDVCGVSSENLPKIDLIIGGSPCQGFSMAGKMLNFEDARSRLFFEYVRLLKECSPEYFLLENVEMKKCFEDSITQILDVKPIRINSALVSAQERKRLYWTNIPGIEQPTDRGIYLEDVVFPDALVDRDKAHAIIGSIGRTTHREYFKKNQGQIVYSAIMLSNIYGGFKETRPRVHIRKSPTIRTAAGGGHIPSLVIDGIQKDFTIEEIKKVIRKVNPIECERLQTLPDNWTSGPSDTQRYKMIGNAWTVDVISHIFKGLPYTDTEYPICERIPAQRKLEVWC